MPRVLLVQHQQRFGIRHHRLRFDHVVQQVLPLLDDVTRLMTSREQVLDPKRPGDWRPVQPDGGDECALGRAHPNHPRTRPAHSDAGRGCRILDRCRRCLPQLSHARDRFSTFLSGVFLFVWFCVGFLVCVRVCVGGGGTGVRKRVQCDSHGC